MNLDIYPKDAIRIAVSNYDHTALTILLKQADIFQDANQILSNSYEIAIKLKYFDLAEMIFSKLPNNTLETLKNKNSDIVIKSPTLSHISISEDEINSNADLSGGYSSVEINVNLVGNRHSSSSTTNTTTTTTTTADGYGDDYPTCNIDKIASRDLFEK